MDKQIVKLIQKKQELKNGGDTAAVDCIRCSANINYLKNIEMDYSVYKLMFCTLIEDVYGKLDGEIFAELSKALDLCFEDKYKGYCLLKAVIDYLEEKREEKNNE